MFIMVMSDFVKSFIRTMIFGTIDIEFENLFSIIHPEWGKVYR